MTDLQSSLNRLRLFRQSFEDGSEICEETGLSTDDLDVILGAAGQPDADAKAWKNVAHRLAGHLDCMMLYCTYPNDSHPRSAMAALQALWKPLGFGGQPRMTGQIKPNEYIIPPLPAETLRQPDPGIPVYRTIDATDQFVKPE